MQTTYLVASQIKNFNMGSNLTTASSGNTFENCVIANDASKKLDFLLLVIETLQINASDTMIEKSKNIGLPSEFSSRVKFWKLRCSNPLRKSYSFTSLSIAQIDSLVELISSMAENLYPLIRQLLSSKESITLNNERWHLFKTRLKSLIRERMNISRGYISVLLDDEKNDFFRELLVILSLSCGPGGSKRLKASLYHQT